MMTMFFKRGEEGFTTVGSAVALLLALSLTFGAVQVCWIQSRSGQVQYVADAAALAADGAVAKVITYAQVIDAALLTLSLLGLSSYAASAVASFIPGGQSVAVRFVDLGDKISHARDRFAKSAAKGLNAAQKALPALCTYEASKVASANGSAQGVSYAAVAIPLPLQTKKLSIGSNEDADKAMQEMVNKENEVQEKVEAQEKAQKELERSKEQAWRADCGDAKSMRERAEHLGGLSGSDNPGYSSPDTWNFSVGISRAKRYYKARLDQEKKETEAYTDDEEMGQGVARKAFYEYALKIASANKVSKGSQGMEFPHVEQLAHGTNDFKKTYLYTQRAYPVSSEGDKRLLHASSACSKCGSFAKGRGSLEEVERGTLAKCPNCKYALATLVRASQLTGIVESGFEYHYQRFAIAAESYASAAKDVEKNAKELAESSESMTSDFKEALKSLSGTRINLKSAGRYGCIAVVWASGQETEAKLPFAGGKARAGNRLALSGACLAKDESVDEAALLQQIGSGLIPSESLAGGLTKAVLGSWGSALAAYAQGLDGAQGVLTKVLGSIPLIGTDLSESVSDKLANAVEDAGLEPAELGVYKPVLTNTALIAQMDDSAFSKALMKAQAAATAYGQASSGDIAGALETLDIPSVDGLELSRGESIALCTLSLLASGLGVGDHELALPFSSDASQILRDSFSYLREHL